MKRLFVRPAPSAIALLVLTGCAADLRIKDQAVQAAAEGNTREAYRLLTEGSARHPQSTPLRAALVSTRVELLNDAAKRAADAVREERFSEARQALLKALELDPTNARLQALLAEVDVQERMSRATTTAQTLAEAGNVDAALRHIEQALKASPRHPALLALQRRLMSEQRDAQLIQQGTLGESRPISLDFRDTPVRTVLDAVSRHSGINFVLDKDVRADTRTTVYVRDTAPNDALELVISSNQLAKKVVDARTVVIYPNTVSALKAGVPVQDTLIGRMLTNTVTALGGHVTDMKTTRSSVGHTDIVVKIAY